MAIGADGNDYPLGTWYLGTGSVAVLSINDAALPASAYPYMLDPTTTFKIAASADDDTVRRHGTSWIPPCDYTYPTSDRLNISRAYDPSTGTYDIHNGLMRWNTS